ncbi:hypothetical protein BF93_17630 [Brachybacterium phenoliresistens]|uniref:Nucleotidyltransferase n=1 Tax=Brachybacterium phenoliresistens TaxID=396014 RepID=Z9JSN3_9MICO|nr:nucleotidyl transferase AbiEii/AbiGii toxin family protein [Brachybacterium phenoliresistens]EWS81390.1 hypothetical protein BF93_17630 [Brachybacterium phenoliresistens]
MIDLTGRTDVPVPEDVVAAVGDRAARLGLVPLLIGAAARDLVIHARQQRDPVRATKDIDIAIAVRGDQEFSKLATALGHPTKGMHRFEVLGVEVDLVPFGGMEHERTIRFPDDHVLDVTGFEEAFSTSVVVRMPRGTEIRVADAPAQTALKILAWRDRRHTNTKDAADLFSILEAISEEPFVDDVWEDIDALDATDDDIISAASYRAGRLAAVPFSPGDGGAVMDVLLDPQLRGHLARDMRSSLAEDLLAAYTAGFRRGLEI